jgi:DNA-binding CsgD family transcriptional regulator
LGVGGVFLKTGDSGDLIAALPRIMTRRQVIALAVADLIAATNAAIAEMLAISAKTVGKHRTDLMRKLGAYSTADLVMNGVRLGLIDAGG